MGGCLYCGHETNGTDFCPGEACKNKAWANRRKFGAVMVEDGLIDDRAIRAYLEARGAVRTIAEKVDG